MNAVQEIGEEIQGQYPHPLYELSIDDFCKEVKECAELFDLELTEQQVLGIAAWVGFDAYEDEDILEHWRAIN